jgi:hypothetical protein
LPFCFTIHRLLYGYEAMNCCDDYGQCTRSKDCPARASNMQSHDQEPDKIPIEWIYKNEWVIAVSQTIVSALLGLALIAAIVFLSWRP